MLRLPFGFTLSRTKSAVEPMNAQNSSALSSRWMGTILESFTGAWQRNIEINTESVITHATVWACITLIANDIAKLWIKLVEEDKGIFTEVDNVAFSPVLRKPNHYQTRVKFIQSWVLSLLTRGNTYVLLERNNRGGADLGNVTSMYVLDPQRVQVLVAPDGSVYYRIGQDYISGVAESGITVPASEIMHDVMVPLYHPLCGLSPVTACGLAATQGLKIQNNSLELFAKGSQLSGVLTAPASISTEVAERIEKYWAENYLGPDNVGKVAVLGDGLKFDPMTMTAVDAQLADQLKWTAEFICSVFHVPPYMVGIGAPPANANVQALTLQYYSQALQALIENIELLLAEGLGLKTRLSVEFDLRALLRMDTATLMKTVTEGVLAGVYTPNEGRAEFDLKPVDGGDSPMMQQQQFSLAALAERDRDKPFSKPVPGPSATPAEPRPEPEGSGNKQIEWQPDEIGEFFLKELMAA